MKLDISIMRHSCAHLVAAAVAELYPKAKFGVGPTVENGFYYDIDFGVPVTEEDLQKIEDKAKEFQKQNLEFSRQEMTLDKSIDLFAKMGQTYKVELLNV
jgi:threonyl-tRNA synthetase